jgi:hypothetical protein
VGPRLNAAGRVGDAPSRGSSFRLPGDAAVLARTRGQCLPPT